MRTSNFIVSNRYFISALALSSIFVAHFETFSLGALELLGLSEKRNVELTGFIVDYGMRLLILDLIIVSCICALLNIYAKYFIKSQYELNHDPLTGVMNRYAYNQRLSKSIEYSQLANKFVATIDVDDFKTLNDNYGHALGDKVLILIGKVITLHVSQCGQCYRIGGDEFVVIFDSQSSSDARALMKTIKDSVQRIPINKILQPDAIKVSIGLTNLINHASLSEAVSEADKEMYADKRGKSEWS